MNNNNKLDGKVELEKALAHHEENSHFGANLLLTDDKIDWSKCVVTGSQATFSFYEPNSTTAISFESRDALLEALCQKVFGAKPTFKQ